ncbi:uncharacterized protein LOC143207359 [Lasioglossum baleicum]|uniref:uncharacterized protein LOC143207359 n=1 Tax=Lasioglossum baleicum TaxID=434251 RepID=UPI003FCDAFE6
MNINEKLPVIKHLFLNNNHLQNIDGINHCSSLESLILDHNQLNTLSLEDFIENNNNLKFLSFENNKINTLKFTKQFEKLEKLYAANNCLTNDDEMQHFCLLENLVELTFEGNHIFTEMNKDRMIAQSFELMNSEIFIQAVPKFLQQPEMGASSDHLKQHFPLQKCYPRLCLGVINECRAAGRDTKF